MNSSIDDARLTAFFDVRQPMAYLALHPTLALGLEEDIDINWLPVRISPLKKPSKPTPDDDRSIRHRRVRANEIAREISTYAEAQGLVMRDYYREPDPGAVNVGWLWVRAHAPEKLNDGRTVDTILAKFEGQEDQMYALLSKMYPDEVILRPVENE